MGGINRSRRYGRRPAESLQDMCEGRPSKGTDRDSERRTLDRDHVEQSTWSLGKLVPNSQEEEMLCDLSVK